MIVLVFLYREYNPLNNIYFPKCPFRSLTGYKCPGCGSQRAIHYLLNIDIYNACKQNFLLVLSVPYLLSGFILDRIKRPGPKTLKWRKTLYGKYAIIIILIIIIAFWILRNIYSAPN
ncbi:DUF2752 domain-containing protein [Saccharicrinis sp. FJH62]|uniref:DUF2752 domain-containing protein n=1 Tax=Saccharicrinis sp. FJH62 TaxID=3344657 RepID=UPI0035D5034F